MLKIFARISIFSVSAEGEGASQTLMCIFSYGDFGKLLLQHGWNFHFIWHQIIMTFSQWKSVKIRFAPFSKHSSVFTPCLKPQHPRVFRPVLVESLNSLDLSLRAKAQKIFIRDCMPKTIATMPASCRPNSGCRNSLKREYSVK